LADKCARELVWTKDDAILVNVLRAEMFDEGAPYRHPVAHPRFFGGLDVWWVEPFRHGHFGTDYSFLELDNVPASPHKAAQAEKSDFGLSLDFGQCSLGIGRQSYADAGLGRCEIHVSDGTNDERC
jgi:hypothetical protein